MSPDKNTSLKPFLVIKFNNNNNYRIIFYFYTSSEIREKFLTLVFYALFSVSRPAFFPGPRGGTILKPDQENER